MTDPVVLEVDDKGALHRLLDWASSWMPPSEVLMEVAADEDTKQLSAEIHAGEGPFTEEHITLLETQYAQGIMPSGADIANAAVNALNGMANIIEDDYPFLCICGLEGKCIDDIQKTSCSMRPGSGHGP